MALIATLVQSSPPWQSRMVPGAWHGKPRANPQLDAVSTIKNRRPDVIVRLHICGRTDSLLSRMRDLPVDIFELDFPVDLSYARGVLGDARVILGTCPPWA